MTVYWQNEEEAFEFAADADASAGVQYWPEDEPAEWGPVPDVPWPVLLVGLLLALWVMARIGPTTTWQAQAGAPASQELSAPPPAFADPPAAAVEDSWSDPEVFAAPYTDYVITQGIHGQSYGHMAIDLAAGKGAPVLSPIDGTVTQVYIDQWGNPTLVIENELYEVKLLHGVYSVAVGQVVRVGDPVGEEGNQGYTTDMRGVPCKGRTDYCGYHTHLNVFSKAEGTNVNPLDLIQRND